MENNNAKNGGVEESKKVALHYMETLVDVARESFLILDSRLRVISANPTFYQNFQVLSEQTENKFLYDLGNGQWNISELKKLLEEILPNKKIVKNYEVTHIFETIGKKTIMLNAKQIDSVQLIILAMEDVSDKKELEIKLTEYAKNLEGQVAERTKELENRLKDLEILNKTMIGRELKMVELKEEIKNLEKLIENGYPRTILGDAGSNKGKKVNGKNGSNNHKNGQ